jgi:perosamine synthetase
MNFKIPFLGRAHKYTDKELELISKVANETVPLTQGRYRDRFEEKFKEIFNSSYAFAVSNATAALELSAQLCQFSKDDEVIIPGHTYTSSAYPFIKKGAKIIWADIDLNTMVVNADTISEKITSKTKAIVVVHLYGYMADMPSIMKLAREHGLIVIEDVAQAAGTAIDGKFAGTFGDFGVFSFHSHKNITTLGEGGMLVCKDEKYADIIPMLRHNGHCGFTSDRKDYWLPAMGNVDLPMLNGQPMLPSNYCLGEVECALGEVLLDRLVEINEQKRTRAIQIIDSLSDHPKLTFNREDTIRHNYHLLVARVDGIDRDVLIRKLAKDFGVQAIVQYYPLYRYDLYRKLGFDEYNCPNTDLFFDSMISFPFHHMMDDSEIEYMVRSLRLSLTSLSEHQIPTSYA